MSAKRAFTYLGKVDPAKKRKINEGVSKVLATCPNFILAEVEENQIVSLEELAR